MADDQLDNEEKKLGEETPLEVLHFLISFGFLDDVNQISATLLRQLKSLKPVKEVATEKFHGTLRGEGDGLYVTVFTQAHDFLILKEVRTLLMQPEIEEAYAYLVTSDGRILLNEVSEEDFQKLKIYHHPLW